jgi:hypothetical protein
VGFVYVVTVSGYGEFRMGWDGFVCCHACLVVALPSPLHLPLQSRRAALESGDSYYRLPTLELYLQVMPTILAILS